MLVQEVTGQLLQRSVEAYVCLVMIVANRTHSFYINCVVKNDVPQLFFVTINVEDNQQREHLTHYCEYKVVLDADRQQPEYIYLGMESILVKCESVERVRRSNRHLPSYKPA